MKPVLSGENEQRTKPTLFYGWVVVAVCFIINLMTAATFYSFGIFFKPLQDEFHWGRAVTSSINTIYLACYAISSYILGRLSDRYGPKVVIAFGAVLIGSGFALCSQGDQIWHFYVFFGIAGLGGGATWAPPMATVQRWFMKKRALVTGIVVSGVGLGTLIFAPILGYLILLWGWRLTVVLVGGVTWLVLSLTILGMEVNPERKGLEAYGGQEGVQARDVSIVHSSNVWTTEQWFTAEAIKTKQFYAVLAMYVLTLFPILTISAHIVRHALDMGVAPVAAASALSFIGGSSIAGKVAMGGAADKIGWKTALAICCFSAAAIVLWLINIKDQRLLYVFAGIYGFFYGGYVPQMLGLVGFFFGTRSLGELIGITHGTALLVGSTGPLLAGYVFDIAGNYAIAFFVAALSFAAAGMLALVTKPPQKKVIIYYKIQ